MLQVVDSVVVAFVVDRVVAGGGDSVVVMLWLSVL